MQITKERYGVEEEDDDGVGQEVYFVAILLHQSIKSKAHACEINSHCKKIEKKTAAKANWHPYE